MNEAPADSPAALAAPKPRGAGKWFLFVALVFAAQVAFVFIFGQKQFSPPRTVSNVPQLQLVDNADEMAALNDPTLFALPNPKDFSAAVWLRMPDVKQPSFRWTSPTNWLTLNAENLGVVFSRFMQTNQFAQFQFDFKPPVELSEPVLPFASALPQNSTLQISGDLAQRRLLNQNEIQLPSLPFNDVIAPSKVQALVDANGNVVSAILLPSANALESAGRADIGETNALQIARTLRFAPTPRATFGELIFNWHTVPVIATNAP